MEVINEYFERICDIGLDYGGTIDNYMGDGVMLTFNVPRSLEDHVYKAVEAAIAMEKAFEELKKEWTDMGGGISGLYTRTAVSCGKVHRATIGHPQRRHLTIMGVPVTVAANLCDAAVRDKNVIVIDDSIYSRLSEKPAVQQMPPERLGKAITFTTTAYEIAG